MAQPPTTANVPEPPVAGAPQPSRSHGRGGAGNIGTTLAPAADSNSLSTPTIKQATYTTGRGGTGNMAQNDLNDPATARAAQDVGAPKAHDREVKGTYHWGRGGEGNMMTVGGSSGNNVKLGEAEPTTLAAKQRQPAQRTGSFHAVVEKGKEILGLGGKKDTPATAAARENAVE